MSDSPDVQDEIFAAYRRLYIENYCIVASSVWLFYDTLATFPKEVQRIWSRKLTGATAIYFLTRYGAVAERITLMVSLFLKTTTDSRCVPVLRLDDTLTDLNYAAIGGFTALRLFGIGSGTWLPLVAVVIIWTARIAIAVYLQVTYTPIAFGPPLFGCGALWSTSFNKIYALDTAVNSLVLASDVLLLAMTWVKTFSIHRQSRQIGIHTPVAALILRDGTIYFGAILVVQILAIVSSQQGSGFILWDVWVYFAQIVTVIFLSRFMLNLRGVYLKSSGGELTSIFAVSDVQFATNIVGNLGAPLDVGNTATSTTVSGEDGWTNNYDSDAEEKPELSSNPLAVGVIAPAEEVEMHPTESGRQSPKAPEA